MTTPITVTHTLWVCNSCRDARENDNPPDPTDPRPWSLLSPGEHRRLANAEACDSGADYCHCGVSDFSQAPCHGCGSQLAGERFRYVILSR